MYQHHYLHLGNQQFAAAEYGHEIEALDHYVLRMLGWPDRERERADGTGWPEGLHSRDPQLVRQLISFAMVSLVRAVNGAELQDPGGALLTAQRLGEMLSLSFVLNGPQREELTWVGHHGPAH